MTGRNQSPRRLTPRQFAVFKFIREQIETKGAPPTRAEIKEQFQLASVNSAVQYLGALRRKGLIEVTPGLARGIRLTEPAMQFHQQDESIPINFTVGGTTQKSWVRIAPKVFSPAAERIYPALTPEMCGYGIELNDWIAVHSPSDIPQDGTLVLISMRQKPHLCLLKQTNAGLFFLRPGDQVDNARPYTHRIPKIIGSVVGIIRKFKPGQFR